MGFDAPFNYDFFISAEAGVIGIREPAFTTNEAKYASMDGLRREPDYYFCAVMKYAISLYIPYSTWNWSDNCTHWLSRGEEIYTLTFWANRQKHIVNKERWHKSCWESLKESILEAGAKIKQQQEEAKAKENFELAQYRLAHPLKRGKKSIQEIYGLTDEQAFERKKILGYIQTYNKRITKYVNIIADTSDTDVRHKAGKYVISNRSKITELEIKLRDGLGGLPGTTAPVPFIAPYDAITQSSLAQPDYYNALDKEHYYEGGDVDYNDASEY